ncbi:TPA: hypothetical protein RZC51_000716 [Burkholderia cenocepacia]|nr:hypothetical protein [Burkholderia cenocepacia]HEB3529259.1 hypothetical protein [Burkholderia cenocepacia]
MPDSVGMKASSTIGALSSYAGAASCGAGALASWAAMPCIAEPNAFDTVADAGAATLPAAAATPATAAAAAVCAASPDGAPPSDAHCAVLASIERSVS